jgi:hypothetical protein
MVTAGLFRTTLTVTSALALQPLASVTTTVYVVFEVIPCTTGLDITESDKPLVGFQL